MRGLRVRFTPEAAKVVSTFHPENKKLIKAAIKELRENPNVGKNLQEELSGFQSFQSRKYRILYRLNDEEHTLEILYVGHRRDVYEQFRLLLNNLTP